MWTIAFVARRDVEAVSFVYAEPDLTGSAVVISDALNVPNLGAAGFPGGSRRSFRCAKEVEVTTTWIPE